jgi:hypothetical protein
MVQPSQDHTPRFGFTRVRAKTANYQCLAGDSGSMFVTTGAGAAVRFTLPKLSEVAAGWYADFFNTVDHNMRVAAHIDDQQLLVAFNQVGADYVQFAATNEKIGSGLRIVRDVIDRWLVVMYLGSETVTPGVVVSSNTSTSSASSASSASSGP